MIRNPSVAGMFYPGEKETLRAELERMVPPGNPVPGALGLISPHAGYIYSGSCAGRGFSRVTVPDRVVILGVNHRGVGYPMAVDGNDGWETPLGTAEVDGELRTELTGESGVFGVDSIPSAGEHSLEVQVPFIQYLNPAARILPITVGTHDREMLDRAGEELFRLISGRVERVLMVSSTDMSHYLSASDAERLDSMVVEKVKSLDPEGLYDTVLSRRISMCGMAPTYIMLKAAKKLGASSATVVEYTHSGHASGDFEQVVGYLSAVIS